VSGRGKSYVKGILDEKLELSFRCVYKSLQGIEPRILEDH
jgi:hypothetical protein